MTSDDLMPPSNFRLERPDATLAGEQLGTGPPILLLHAGAESRRVWRPVARRLAAGGFSAVAYDQRGHGDSDGASERLVPFAGDVAAMIGALSGRPLVVGASLGGLAALLALADDGVARRVSGLVLVDVVPDPQPARARSYLRSALPDGGDRPLVGDILSRGAQLAAVAAGLTLPLLLIRGGVRSPLTDGDVGRLRLRAPHLEVVTVPRASHLVARDAPDEAAAEILRFATAVAGDGGVAGRLAVAPGPCAGWRRSGDCVEIPKDALGE